MKINDLIMMSIRSLWRRKLRTFLTILGVVIGSTSIVLMLSLGIAMDENFKSQMEGMQSLTVIEVYPNSGAGAKAPKLDEKGLRLLEEIPGVQKVIPTRSLSAYLRFGKYGTADAVEIQGLSKEEADILGYKIGDEGIFESDEKKVIVIGSEIMRRFVKSGQTFDWYNPPEPLDLKVNEDFLKVDLGQYNYETMKPATDPKGNQVEIPRLERVRVGGLFPASDTENSYITLVPLELFEELQKEQQAYNAQITGQELSQKSKNAYNNVRVKVADEEQVELVQQAIQDAGFMANSLKEYLNEMNKISQSIQMLLGGIGGIALLVAAIGITNTMMMSIYERTKEIGVMKVIGAKLNDIKMLFLVEALLIGALGGIMGITISYMGSFLINQIGGAAGDMTSMMGSGAISVIPPWLALSALAFSTVIGLLAGYFPAKRAMNLSALTAIRTE